MEKTYKPLIARTLRSGAGVEQAAVNSPKPVLVTSPAVDVMTDLRTVAAATIDADLNIDAAQHAMIARGVRSVLVVEGGQVVGLLTARDLQGERPMQVVQERGIKHEEVLVRHVMTLAATIEVLDMADVLRSQVGHIVATLKQAGRQHALVVDQDALSGREMVRGVFSLSQIARQLGLPLQATELARTFSEIERAIVA